MPLIHTCPLFAFPLLLSAIGCAPDGDLETPTGNERMLQLPITLHDSGDGGAVLISTVLTLDVGRFVATEPFTNGFREIDQEPTYRLSLIIAETDENLSTEEMEGARLTGKTHTEVLAHFGVVSALDGWWLTRGGFAAYHMPDHVIEDALVGEVAPLFDAVLPLLKASYRMTETTDGWQLEPR